MLPDAKIKCPHTGFAKTCRSIVSKWECPKYVKIDGMNPNTGEQVSKFGCIDSFLHMLLIENSQMQRQTGGAVESARNEAAKAADAQVAAVKDHIQTQQQAVRVLLALAAQTAQTLQRLDATALPNGTPVQITHQQD